MEKADRRLRKVMEMEDEVMEGVMDIVASDFTSDT